MKNRSRYISLAQMQAQEARRKKAEARRAQQAQAIGQATGTAVLRLMLLCAFTLAALFVSMHLARATEIQKVVSPGGIEAWLVEDHTVPIIAMDFSFAGGTAQDVPGKEGMVSMLSSLLDEGAADLDSSAFQTALEENAIKLRFDASRDHFYGSLRTLTPNRDLAFDLLGKALQAPRFDQEPIERMRASWISQAKRSESNPDAIVGRAFRAAVYGDHPYSLEPTGTGESLAAITRADLVAGYKAIITHQHLVIGVVGAIDAKTLAPMLDAVFAPLPETGTLKDIKPVSLSRTGDLNVALDASQTLIRFAAPGIDRHDKDFYAAYLVNHILGGGGFSSRLYNEIREKRGLAYGVYSYLMDLDHIALLGGGMSTRTDNTTQALSLVKAEIARMGKDGPTEEELADAKKYLIGSYPLRFDSSTKIARQLVGIQEENLGIDYFDKRNSYIDAVTLDDAKRAAKRLCNVDKLFVVTAGKEMKTTRSDVK